MPIALTNDEIRTIIYAIKHLHAKGEPLLPQEQELLDKLEKVISR